jgi:transcription termination factor NusB
MSNEQFERRMEFILEQQAKLEENFAKQQEHNAQAIARMDLVDRQIAELVGFTGLRDAL